ncbi:uncharacterized protein LOC135103678 isoform X2 [Scylla paramamosain]|uniref:uncharacterized protein LOC135103678 isoform X2 n=1 Tax=Scylla paramamosain TaxID=85552 RepID=UPI003082C311
MVAVDALLVVVVLGVAGVCEASDDGDEMTTSDVASVVLEQIQSHLASASYSLQGRMYGSCTDSFSIFGFLAFLLALLDLVMELQNMNETGRRRREATDEAENEVTDLTCQDLEMQEAASASYSLLRGFLNALAAQDQECANKFVCEGAEEAAAAGPLGEVVSRVARMLPRGCLRSTQHCLPTRKKQDKLGHGRKDAPFGSLNASRCRSPTAIQVCPAMRRCLPSPTSQSWRR